MRFLNNFEYIDIIPITCLVLLLLGITAAIFIKPHDFQRSRTYVFISILASLAVVILACNVFLTTINLDSQRGINNTNFTKTAIDKLWLYPNDLLTKKKAIRPEFLASFYYNNLALYRLTQNLKTEPTIASTIEEQFIAITFIQCWEDFLTFRELDKTGDLVWLYNFIQWAQSPYLKIEFERLKYNYAPTTIEFGNLLFEYAQNIPVPTTDVSIYSSKVKKLYHDPRLVAVFNQRKNQPNPG